MIDARLPNKIGKVFLPLSVFNTVADIISHINEANSNNDWNTNPECIALDVSSLDEE